MAVQDSEEIYLPLSGIQHMAFCPRQWALIHVEQVWAENARTVDGKYMHHRVDDPFENETRGDLIMSRSVPVISHTLKLQGVADIVEFWRTTDTVRGAALPRRKGLWIPVPIEYKRGRSKSDDRDWVQLCAQAVCLEEMLGVSISEGYLFYGQTHRREAVQMTDELRRHTTELSKKMYDFYSSGITPPAIHGSKCELCSLIELCVPKLTWKNIKVGRYLNQMLQELDP